MDNGHEDLRRVMTDGTHCSIGLDLCGYLFVPPDGRSPSCTRYKTAIRSQWGTQDGPVTLRCDTRGALCCQKCLEEQARLGEETA